MGATNLHPTITITHWPSLWETHKGSRVDVTLPELVDWILSYAERPHTGEGWAPATFAGKRSKANVEAAHAIGLDFDEGALVSDLVAHLRDFVGVVHETRHSAPGERCARAVLFASRPMTAREYELVRSELARRCNLAGLATDEQTKDASRFWYLPGACPGGCEKDCGGMPPRTLMVHALEGNELVDVDELVVETETRAAIQDDRPDPAPSAPRMSSLHRVERAERYLERVPPAISGSGGHAHTFVTAQKMVRGFDLSHAEALQVLRPWNRTCQPPWSERELRRKIQQADEHGTMARGQLLNAPNPNVREETMHTSEEGPTDARTMWEGAVRQAVAEGRYDDAADALRRLTKAANSQEPGIEVLDGPQIAAPLPPLEYLIAEIGLCAEGGAPHLVAGYGFAGKTMSLQALALALVAGLPVWGALQGGPPRRVMHVDLEQGERLTRRRYQRLALGMGLSLASLGDGLGLVAMPRLTLAPEHREQWAELMTGRDLIIIDSLRAAMPGAEENSSEFRSGLDMLGSVSDQTGCRAVVLHHARKPSADTPAGGRYAIRGSSAIFDGCDGVYVFAAEKGEPTTVEHVKARSHGELVEEWALVIEDVQIAGDPKAGLRVSFRGHELVDEHRQREAEAKEAERTGRDMLRVRQAIADHPGITTTQLRGLLKLNGARLAAAVLRLGAEVEKREVGAGRTRGTGHFIRGGS